MLGPIDLYVCLYLSKPGTRTPRFERVAEDLGIGIGTAHRSVGRLMASGLVLPSRTVQRRALLDVVLHAVRHVYYVEPGGLTRGVPTADAAPPLASVLTPSDPPPVWPDPLGDTRGLDQASSRSGAARGPARPRTPRPAGPRRCAADRPGSRTKPRRGRTPRTARDVNPAEAIGRVADACSDDPPALALPLSSARGDAVVLWAEGGDVVSVTPKIMAGPLIRPGRTYPTPSRSRRP